MTPPLPPPQFSSSGQTDCQESIAARTPAALRAWASYGTACRTDSAVVCVPSQLSVVAALSETDKGLSDREEMEGMLPPCSLEAKQHSSIFQQKGTQWLASKGDCLTIGSKTEDLVCVRSFIHNHSPIDWILHKEYQNPLQASLHWKAKAWEREALFPFYPLASPTKLLTYFRNQLWTGASPHWWGNSNSKTFLGNVTSVLDHSWVLQFLPSRVWAKADVQCDQEAEVLFCFFFSKWQLMHSV